MIIIIRAVQQRAGDRRHAGAPAVFTWPGAEAAM